MPIDVSAASPEADDSAKSNTIQKRTCRLFRGSNPNQLAEPDESATSNTNQKRTCRLFRGSNPNKFAESDESDESYTKNDLSDCSTVGPLTRLWTRRRSRPPGGACQCRAGRDDRYGRISDRPQHSSSRSGTANAIIELETIVPLSQYLRLSAHLQLMPVLEAGEEILVGGQAVIEGVMMRAP